MSLSEWLQFIFVSIAVILLQVLIIDQIEISRFVHPQVYFLMLMGLPAKLKNWHGLTIAFLMGIVVDGFLNTPGLHAFVCTLMAFLRYTYLNNFADQDWLSTNARPSFYNMETLNYLVYTGVFSMVFHFVYFSMENLSFRYFDEILLKTLYSTSLSMLLILLLQFTFSPRVQNE